MHQIAVLILVIKNDSLKKYQMQRFHLVVPRVWSCYAVYVRALSVIYRQRAPYL